jgi:hypothetical protein
MPELAPHHSTKKHVVTVHLVSSSPALKNIAVSQRYVAITFQDGNPNERALTRA